MHDQDKPLHYVQPQPMSRQDAEAALQSDDSYQVVTALLSLALYDPDWQWVQAQCLKFVDSTDTEIQLMAILGFAHIARIHGKLDLDVVLPVLKRLQSNPELQGRIEDALDDIEMFIINQQD